MASFAEGWSHHFIELEWYKKIAEHRIFIHNWVTALRKDGTVRANYRHLQELADELYDPVEEDN